MAGVSVGDAEGGAMQIGMIGLGRMGANMVRRLMGGGHECVVYARDAASVRELAAEGATGAESLGDLVARLEVPRTVWIMIPAAAVDEVIAELVPLLAPGDTVIDGGNSHFADDMRRARELSVHGLHYLDVGVSGGVFGLTNGYCLMIGGEREIVARLTPVFATLSPSGRVAEPAARSTASLGYLHCGPVGAGHFVKMVHNGVEYGLMAAYAEGLNLLQHADIGHRDRRVDAETSPLAAPELFKFDFDVAAIAELWRHGSVVRSWLLDLLSEALDGDPVLERFNTAVADSGEGRWTVQAAIEAGVPTPVLATALFARFSSRSADDYANRVLSALRYQFGGHAAPPQRGAGA
jgi:6-phosphogluconate dehydrogenase